MAARPRPTRSHPTAAAGADRPTPPRPTTVVIDASAGRGQTGLALGDRVPIQTTGLYAGEHGRIERFAGSAIPAAVVRTESGKLRHVRTIDIVRSPAGSDGPREAIDGASIGAES